MKFLNDKWCSEIPTDDVLICNTCSDSHHMNIFDGLPGDIPCCPLG